MDINKKELERLKRLAGIIKESVEQEPKDPEFTTFEFDNDLEINHDNDELFQELADKNQQDEIK